MIGTRKQKPDNKGFTLAELLVVIAIIGILAGVSFVAVGKYIRNLQQLEMDNTAKEIFIAAQNHLSASYASGEFKRNYEKAGSDAADDFGESLSQRPGYAEDDDTLTGNEEYRYIIYEGYHADHSDTPGTKKAVLEKYMLPIFSIDSEIADKGNYIIAYEANSASVLAVFYSGRAHTFFGSEKVHIFADAEAEESGNTYLADAVADRNKRIHYRESEEDTIIGCYTSNGRDIIPEKTFKPLTLSLKNGARLTAEITNPNYVVGDSSQILTLVVKGCTSENIQTIKLKGKGDTSVSGSTFETSYDNTNGPAAATENRTYSSSVVHYSSDAVNHEEVISFTLDDITVEKGHFCNNFPYLIPGEDVEVYVELSDTESFASTIRSETETENSLFENISFKGSKASVAEIGNIRHLENLDPDISNLSFINTLSSVHTDLRSKAAEIEIKNAEQISDISYSGADSFISELSGNTTQHVSTYSVYKYGGTSGDRKEGYYGIANENLKAYDGHGKSIYYIYSKTGSGEHTGIFSKVLFNSPSDDFTVKNLTVREGRFYGTNDSSAIIGHSDYNVVIENCTVTGYETDVNSENANAGGLVGACSGRLSVNNSVVSGYVINIGAKASDMASGGLVGKCTGSLSLKYSDLEGASVNVTSTGGTSGGIIGDAAAVTFTSSFLKADTLQITGNANAGGIIGKISGVSTLSGDCFISGNLSNNPNITIKANAGNAGGVIGYSTSQLTVTGFDINGSDFASFNIQGTDSTGGNAGGIVGKAEGPLTIDTSYVIGKFLNLKANNAGGIAGSTSGKLDIKKTYASAYVFGISNAGGFIGSINGGIDNKIDACYASGHTKNGSYSTGTVKTAAADNYNVQSGGNSGGFIGYVSSVTVSNSYTTCSAYSSAAAGYAGGFAGQTVNMSVSNCYSAGLVGIATGGKIGGFAGFGTVSGSATGNSYYLKGNGFNDTLSAGSSGSVISYVLNTAGSEIQATSAVNDTNPWDTTLASKKYKYKTTYMLSGNTAGMSSHYGDWTEVEEDKLTLTLVNAEKLTAILSVPTSYITGSGNYASFLVEGKKSGKAAYMQFELAQHDITPIDKSTAIYNITLANGGNTSDADQEYLSFPEYTFPSNKNLVVKTEGSYTEFHIDLDDITTVNKNFASIFTAFTPGEDIRVTAEWGALSWDTMMTHADQELALEQSQRVPITGRTNSLFASGSGNDNYTDKSYYSDRYPDADIIEPGGSEDAYSGMALVTNFRHLQNLDTEVSNVTADYTKAKICRDLYWDTASVSGLNAMPAGDLKAFVPAMQAANDQITPVRIYAYNKTEPLTIEEKSAFYGIVNSNLAEFDGGYHSVNNLLIYNTNSVAADGSAGFFRSVTIKESDDTKTKTIKNFTVVEPVVVSEKGAAGGLIGDTGTGNAGTIVVQSVYVYGKKAIVRTLSTDASSSSKANAGGLIGTALLGGYTIENSGASVYVYAEKARCAGGFIGSMQPRSTSSITNCFVGGHVGNEPNSDLDENGSVETEVYLKIKALADAGTIGSNITVAMDGGYNVVSKVAIGGFVGYIGTSSISGDVKFTDCFTTASAYSSKTVGGTVDYSANGGAVGGFIGRLQHKNQKYERCYAEGKVWSGTDAVGMFAGQFYNASESTKPTFKACLVLTGLNFNTDMHMMYNSSTAADTVSGITVVEAETEIIRAEYPEYIHVKVFNKTLKEFPYKDMSTYPIDGQTWYVFFGDWVEPESLSPITVVNENRLIASISLRDETTGTEYHYGQEYDVTYIRVKNPAYNTVFRVLHKNGVIYKTERYEGYAGDDPNDDTKWSDIYDDGAFSASISGGKLDFYIDDISHYKGCYRDKVRFSTAGEDITVYVGASYNGTNGVMSESAVHDTGNSLFQKVELKTDGTYTAYISNSRHLQNLDTQISGSVINVSKAIQTDDIYWQDDGTRPYSANTKPYLMEMTSTAHIYRYNATGINDYATPEGCMLPITKQASLKEYDGGGYEIHGIQLGSDHSSDSGLFGGITDSFEIYDLVLKNSTVRSAAASGVLIGKVAADLTVTNVWVNGKVDVYGVDSGGLIGYIVSGNVTLKNDNVFAGSGTVSNATNSPYNGGTVGGLIGRISGGNIKISNSFASAYVIGDGTGAGGFIGAIDGSSCTGNIYNCYSSGYTINGTGVVSVTGRNCKGIGGFIGYALGAVTIEKCFSTCYITSTCATAYPGEVIDYMGGFVGIASEQLRIDSCYTISDVIPTGVNLTHYGLFAGRTDGSVAIADSYYVNRLSRPLYPIAVNGTGSVVNPDNVYDPGNNIYPEHILGSAENATLSAYTYHHDTNTIISAIGYPYKNWTDSNGGAPETTPWIVFFGDW